MLGLSSPVPSTMTASPSMNLGVVVPSAKRTWPSEIAAAPQSTARRAPSKRSASQPPGIAMMYTPAV